MRRYLVLALLIGVGLVVSWTARAALETTGSVYHHSWSSDWRHAILINGDEFQITSSCGCGASE